MNFYIHSDMYDSHECLELRRSKRAAAIGLWGLAGSWASSRLTGGIVPENVVRVVGYEPADAEALVSVGFWDRHRSGYEFKGATAAYEAVDMDSSRRPTQYVRLLYCKLPSQAFIDWHAKHGLAKHHKITRRMRAEVIREHGMVCWLCARPINSERELHLDHVLPRSFSGEETADNLRPAHARCNVMRGNRSVEAFRKLLRADEALS